jgi:hypothetical protein
MFRELLAHPQEALHSDTWYIACVLCQLAAPGLNPWFHYSDFWFPNTTRDFGAAKNEYKISSPWIQIF